jgi:pseudaminic acid biosynthesis-associated methylase
MKDYQTEQEQFWAGEFGREYILRNQGDRSIASNVALFSKILSKTANIETIIEFGANIGLNLQAIATLLPQVNLSAIEINQEAVDRLKNIFKDKIQVYPQSILDYSVEQSFDFVLIKGVLIHINPNYLERVYDLLYHSSKTYICIVEYYNPTPVEVLYRGHQGKLFKRDFAGEMLDRFDDLNLLEYGFIYHRDNQFPQDDANWFLLKKQ